MLSLRTLPFFHSPPSASSLKALFSSTPSSPVSVSFHKILLSLSFSSKPFAPKSLISQSLSSTPSSQMSSANTIEHFVLFHVKDEAEPSKIDAMISGLRSLSSLDFVLHLSAGPILRNRSSSFEFTHLLHSRYKTKEDLSQYSSHPSHVSVVKECVLPICDDIMAVDWVADLVDGPLIPRSGSAMRLTFLKPKEGLADGDREAIFGVLGGIKSKFPSIDQLSFGENFSPARAKGFTSGFLSIFPGLKELDALDENAEVVELQKEKVRPLLDSVLVVDYVIPTPSANL